VVVWTVVPPPPLPPPLVSVFATSLNLVAQMIWPESRVRPAISGIGAPSVEAWT